MRRVGADSARVAVIGVALPFLLGFAAARAFLPEASLNTDLFIAATLGATSVGITARVLKDLHCEQSTEAHVILGAAIMDDVLGLLMLAIVTGIIVSGGVDPANVASIIVLSLLFIGGVLYLGPYFLRLVIRLFCQLDLIEAKMFTSYLFVMILAWLANLVGLATIIGAFTAGLILNDTFFERCGISRADYGVSIKSLIMPLEVILVPIFFILMGIQVKLESFFDPHVLIMAGGLLVAAVVGKLANYRTTLRRAARERDQQEPRDALTRAAETGEGNLLDLSVQAARARARVVSKSKPVHSASRLPRAKGSANSGCNTSACRPIQGSAVVARMYRPAMARRVTRRASSSGRPMPAPLGRVTCWPMQGRVPVGK